VTPLHRLDTPRRLLLSVAVLLGLLWAPLPAPAQLDKPPAVVVDLDALDADRQMKAMRYPIRARISRYLSAAAEEIDEEKPDEAEALLLKLNPKRMNPYERALVYRMLAFIAYGSAQQDKAIGYFEQVLGEEVLPLRDESKIRFSVAQLHAGLERGHRQHPRGHRARGRSARELAAAACRAPLRKGGLRGRGAPPRGAAAPLPQEAVLGAALADLRGA
jgi:hypothetical protein